MDLFSGENRIAGAITFDPAFVDSIIKYKRSNRLIFGVKSDKKPAPIEVKKLVLILVSAGILGHSATVATSEKEGESSIVKINCTLSPSTHNKQCNSTGLALFDDIYWRRIKVRDPPVV